MSQHWVVTFDSVDSPVRSGASTFIGTEEAAKGQLRTLVDTHTWKEDGDTFTIYTSTDGGGGPILRDLPSDPRVDVVGFLVVFRRPQPIQG